MYKMSEGLYEIAVLLQGSRWRWQPVVMLLLFQRLREAAGSKVQSVDIPQTSQQSLKFPLLVSAPLSDRCPCPSSSLFSFLPLLSLLARVNLHHVFFNGERGGWEKIGPWWKRVNPIPL